MNLMQLANGVQKVVRANSPSILTAFGISGAVSTAILAGRASFKAAKRLSEGPPIETMTKMEIVEEVWDLYIPAAIAGSLTVGCIFGANHISSKRTAAAYTVLAVMEKSAEQYKDKVVEEIGEKKEKAIRDRIAQESVTNNPPAAVVMVGSGNVLCRELFTGRDFNSDMETIRRAENDINAKLNAEMYATLNDFYYMLGIPPTSDSGGFGWQSGKQLRLDFTATLTEDSRPCLAFTYNYIDPI